MKANLHKALCFFLSLMLIVGSLSMMSLASGDTYPRYTGSSNSLVDGLKAVGAPSSFSDRAAIASANGLNSYRGTASENVWLLNRLRAGTLKRPGASTTTTTSGYSGGSGSLANLSRVRFIRQDSRTCKATALAMALNLLMGYDCYTTSSMGGSCCKNMDGWSVNGVGITYKTDSYVGSIFEESAAINRSLAQGYPAVAAVHSRSTSHHWIVIIGKQGADFLAVDPARSGSGSMQNNVYTMSSLGYSFGLTDYSQTHYGYIVFGSTSGSTGGGSSGGSSYTQPSVSYLPRCSQGYTSLVDALKSVGAQSSYSYRCSLARANNISNYRGSYSDNTTMLNLLKAGQLIKP